MTQAKQVDRRQLFRGAAALVGTVGVSGTGAYAADSSNVRITPWQSFCEELKRAGEVVLRPEAPQDDLTQAEGYRYLTRLLRAALDQEIECSDPRFPSFYQLSNETIKIGADNPDNLYANARISGALDYRIRGRRGTVNYLSLSTKSGGYGKGDRELLHTGEIDSQRLQVGTDGNFEVIVSARRHDGNWLPMTAGSSMLIVRQTFLDRAHETPAELEIECLSGVRQPAPLELSQVTERLAAANRFVSGTASLFADWAMRFKANPNGFTVIPQEFFQRAGGDPTIFYAHGYWDLAPDEALVVEVPAIASEFWNFQVDNYWMESLDYRYFNIHLNKHTARANADGSVTLVVSLQDPGRENWVSTAGHTVGTMLYRAVHAVNPSYPKAQRMKVRELRGAG